MSRYTGQKLKPARRLGQMLPGLTRKSTENRPHPPGQHGPEKRAKRGDYQLRLCEAQKLRYNYGVTEKRLRRYFKEASRQKGDTGQNMLRLVESRLDNMVFRAGFAPTIPAARQLVSHGHIMVKRKAAGQETAEFQLVNIPSFEMKVGDVITVKEKSRQLPVVQDAMENPTLTAPAYLSIEKGAFEATVNHKPERDDIPVEIQENLIIEHYSRVA